MEMIKFFFSINLIHVLHRSPAVLVLFAAFGLRFNSASSATSATWHWILYRCHAFLLKAVSEKPQSQNKQYQTMAKK